MRQLTLLSRPRSVGLILGLTCALTMALFYGGTAHAGVAALGKPAYTKTEGNATFWWNWQAIDGYTANSIADYRYVLCFDTYHNGVHEEQSDNPNAGSRGCGFVRSGPSPSGGTTWATPYAASTVLSDGDLYEMCANGYYDLFGFWKLDVSGSNCVWTVIDNNRPTVDVSIDGGAASTSNPELALHIAYSDTTSPPWLGANGLASNWTCVSRGAPCTPGGAPDPNCSARHFADARTDYFDCRASLASAEDGTWYFCAVAADSAVPDSHTTPSASATSAQANLSEPACAQTTLDRAGPRVSVSASSTTVTVGTPVTLTATSSDDGSGPSGSYTWDTGDGGASVAGASVAHTYTQAGTYTVTARSVDRLGNAGQGTLVITVRKPPTPPSIAQNTAAPGISGGTLPDQKLSCSTGQWTNAPTHFEYSWTRDGVAIVGAHSSFYTITPTDPRHQLQCSVVASNSTGPSAPKSSERIVPEDASVDRPGAGGDGVTGAGGGTGPGASVCRVGVRRSMVHGRRQIHFVPARSCGRVTIQRRTGRSWHSIKQGTITGAKGTRVYWRARHAGKTIAHGTARM